MTPKPAVVDAMKYLAHGFVRRVGRVNTHRLNKYPIETTINIVIHQYRVNITDVVVIALSA